MVYCAIHSMKIESARLLNRTRGISIRDNQLDKSVHELFSLLDYTNLFAPSIEHNKNSFWTQSRVVSWSFNIELPQKVSSLLAKTKVSSTRTVSDKEECAEIFTKIKEFAEFYSGHDEALLV